MMIRAIIVEDMLGHYDSLKAYIEEYCKNINIVKHCRNVEESVSAVELYHPDLVFLDVELGGNETGFDFLKEIGEDNISFHTIFTTGHKHHAEQAIDFCAIHFLVKPVQVDKLLVAVKRVAEKIQLKQENQTAKALLQNMKKSSVVEMDIFVPKGKGKQEYVRLKIANIMYITTEQNYPILHVYCEESKDKLEKHADSRTEFRFKRYSELLCEAGFFRIHQSHLINPDFVAILRSNEVVMKDGAELAISRSYKNEFLKFINKRRLI